MNKLASLSVWSCYVCRVVTLHLNVSSAPTNRFASSYRDPVGYVGVWSACRCVSTPAYAGGQLSAHRRVQVANCQSAHRRLQVANCQPAHRRVQLANCQSEHRHLQVAVSQRTGTCRWPTVSAPAPAGGQLSVSTPAHAGGQLAQHTASVRNSGNVTC
jgi:hypothetical protein